MELFTIKNHSRCGKLTVVKILEIVDSAIPNLAAKDQLLVASSPLKIPLLELTWYLGLAYFCICQKNDWLEQFYFLVSSSLFQLYL